MHTLQLNERIPLTKTEAIEPGSYLVENRSGSQIMARVEEARMDWFDHTAKPFDETKDWNGKSILVMRVGGFGDIILLTPILREMKRRWPSAHIAVCSMTHYGQVLKNLPFVDELLAYPLAREKAAEFDAQIFYENAIEQNPRAKDIHMTDLFAEIAGLSGDFDKKPEIALTTSETIAVLEMYPRVDGVRRLCVQGGSSAIIRNYSEEGMGTVIAALLKKGWEVFLMGARGELQVKEIEGLRNLSMHGLSFRQSCAVINNADCVLGPDSALIHVAGALGVPAVALYGPFPWKLRTAYCPTTFAIQGHGPCAPCFHHANPARGNHFPENGPCRKSGKCDVLASIQPDRIIAEIEKRAKKFELTVL